MKKIRGYFIDTHSHLYFPEFKDDLPEVIRRARLAQVLKIITLGTDLASSIQALSLANRFEEVYAGIGVHPSEAHRMEEVDPRKLLEMIGLFHTRIVAIGEIGLDFYREKKYASQQYEVFLKMIRLAQECSLPVVIHNRSAHREMQWFFQENKITRLQGVMHCFSGDLVDARFYLEMGLYISFAGNITYPKFRHRNVVRAVPLQRLLLETDAPFLSPQPVRKQRNEPAFIPYIAQALAEMHKTTVQEIAQITTQNARSLFGLPD